MRFFTAVFGDTVYGYFVDALRRSVEQYSPGADLTVFELSDGEVVDIVGDYGAFYAECFDNRDNNRWQRVNVLKLELFRRMMERFAGESVCWIDADTLVLAPLAPHFDDRVVNVVRHGRRPNQYDCGHGLRLSGQDMVLGGIYALPQTGEREYLEARARARPFWEDSGRNSNSGDQVLINHLVYSGGFPVRFLDDDYRYIYNLQTQSLSMHPQPRDPKHREIRIDEDGSWVLDNRRMVFFYWTRFSLGAQIDDGFAGFECPVRDALRNLYKCST